MINKYTQNIMGTKRNIDINRIRKSGGYKITTGIYIGNGSSNRECNYVVRGTGSGSYVDYDKVDYELTLTNHLDIDANGGTWNSSDRVSINKRIHGNGVVDNGLALSPATYTVSPNTSTAVTKTGTFTLTQYDGSEEFSGYDGASETFTWTQIKDYPVGISLSLGTPPVIPASGGSVNSVAYTATTTFKSGNISTSYGNMAWTGVTSTSKGTTTSSKTTAGTLTGKVTYTCNGHTVTDTKSVTVYQAANNIEYTTWSTPSLTIVKFSTPVDASGGYVSRTQNASASQSGTETYTSRDSKTVYNTSFTWNISSNQTYAIINNGTTTTPTLNFDPNSYTYTRNATIKTEVWGADSKYNSGSVIVTQDAHVSYYVSINPDTINIPALGTVQTATVYSNTSWNISSTKPSWLWISKTSGGPNESGENIQFSAATHTTTGTSSTTITLTGTMGGSATATVNRMSDTPYVTPSISKNTVESAATSVTITISSNTDWTISSDSSWATLSQTAGTGNASITVTVDENTLTSSRSATFTVGSTSCTPSPSTLTLTQNKKSLKTPKITNISIS